MQKRIYAGLIDYLIMILISLILLFIYSFSIKITFIGAINGTYSWIGLFSLFKDLPFRNASIGKKIMGLEIRKNNNQIPSLFTIIFRNITIIVWPIELFLIWRKRKMIRDDIFNTKIVSN